MQSINTRRELTADEALRALEACNDITSAPSGSGVYVLSKGSETLYIGEAKNLWRRLNNHERRALLQSAGVDCRIVQCLNHKEVEKWLIAALKPSRNGVSEHILSGSMKDVRKTRPPCDQRMTITFKPEHRQMLEWLARHQRRSMGSVIRLAIERVYQAEMARGTRAVGEAIARPQSSSQ